DPGGEPERWLLRRGPQRQAEPEPARRHQLRPERLDQHYLAGWTKHLGAGCGQRRLAVRPAERRAERRQQLQPQPVRRRQLARASVLTPRLNTSRQALRVRSACRLTVCRIVGLRRRADDAALLDPFRGAFVQPVPVGAPGGADLRLRLALVVGGGDHGQNPFDSHQHDAANLALAAAAAVEGEPALEQRAVVVHGRAALEAKAPAADLVDDVDLDARPLAQVLDGARRADVGKYDMLVVPDGGRALGREVGRAVRADGSDEAEPLLGDQLLHLRCELHRLAHGVACFERLRHTGVMLSAIVAQPTAPIAATQSTALPIAEPASSMNDAVRARP